MPSRNETAERGASNGNPAALTERTAAASAWAISGSSVLRPRGVLTGSFASNGVVYTRTRADAASTRNQSSSQRRLPLLSALFVPSHAVSAAHASVIVISSDGLTGAFVSGSLVSVIVGLTQSASVRVFFSDSAEYTRLERTICRTCSALTVPAAPRPSVPATRSDTILWQRRERSDCGVPTAPMMRAKPVIGAFAFESQKLSLQLRT